MTKAADYSRRYRALRGARDRFSRAGAIERSVVAFELDGKLAVLDSDTGERIGVITLPASDSVKQP